MKQTMLLSRADRSGQALAELGILLPLLMVLALGALDFGRLFYQTQAVESAAAAGAQYGCTSTNFAMNTNGIVSAALAQAQDITNRSVSITSTINSNLLSVTVSSVFTTTINWPGIPYSNAIQRTAVMQILPAW